MDHTLAWHQIDINSNQQYHSIQIISAHPSKTIILHQSQIYTLYQPNLYPRSNHTPHRLQQLQYINYPEVKRCLQNRIARVGYNCLVDGRTTYQEDSLDCEKFYSLALERAEVTKKPQIISVCSDVGHIHTHYFFKAVVKSPTIWPYKMDLLNVSRILRLLYHQVTININIQFTNSAISKITITPMILKYKYSQQLLSSFATNQPLDYPITSQAKLLSSYLIQLQISIHDIRKVFRMFSIIRMVLELKVQELDLGNQSQLILTYDLAQQIAILLNSSELILREIIVGKLKDRHAINWRIQILAAILYQHLLIRIISLINDKLISTNHQPRQSQDVTFISIDAHQINRDVSYLQVNWLKEKIMHLFCRGVPDTNLDTHLPTKPDIFAKLKKQESSINQHLIDEDIAYYQQYVNMLDNQLLRGILRNNLQLLPYHESEKVVQPLCVSKSKDNKYNTVINYTDDWKLSLSQQQLINTIVTRIKHQNQHQQPTLRLKIIHFIQKYQYTQLLKQIHRSTIQQSPHPLEERIKTTPSPHIKIVEDSKVQLQSNTFEIIQQQRTKQHQYITKIIKQFRVYRFVKNIKMNKKKTLNLIKANLKLLQFIKNRKKPYFQTIRKAVSIKKIINSLNSISLRLSRKSFKQIKKYGGVKWIVKSISTIISQRIKKRSLLFFKPIKHKYYGTKLIKLVSKIKQQKYKQSFNQIKKVSQIYQLVSILVQKAFRKQYHLLYKSITQKAKIKINQQSKSYYKQFKSADNIKTDKISTDNIKPDIIKPDIIKSPNINPHKDIVTNQNKQFNKITNKNQNKNIKNYQNNHKTNIIKKQEQIISNKNSLNSIQKLQKEKLNKQKFVQKEDNNASSVKIVNNQETNFQKSEINNINKVTNQVQNINKSKKQQEQPNKIQIKVMNPKYKQLKIETQQDKQIPHLPKQNNKNLLKVQSDLNQKKQQNQKLQNQKKFIQDKKSIQIKNKNEKSSKKSKQKNSQRSQIIEQISRSQLQIINDNPVFSLDIWLKKINISNQSNKNPPKVNHRVFSKYESVKPIPKQQQQNKLKLQKVDQGFKARINLHPFFAFIRKNVREGGDQVIKQYMCHQNVQLDKPLLSFYPIKQYQNAFKQSFNCILKIGKNKNSSKQLCQLLNIIVAPIHQSYNKQYQNAQNIFEDEPTLYPDYSSQHNIIKDEIFLYFLKQLLSNKSEQSMQCLVEALTILTKYYYPSPMFIYEFINCMQNIYQNTNFQQIEKALENTFLMAQAMERNKGEFLRIYENQIKIKQQESSQILYLRKSKFTKQNIKNSKLKICLLNNEAFIYSIRNETIRTIKHKILQQIGLSKWINNFGIYIQDGSSKSKNISQKLIEDSKKAVDLISQIKDNAILYLKIKYYFPFNVKDFYISRMVYLNMIHQQNLLPWNEKDYQMIVCFSMLYDEFDELRISNYLKISKQSQSKQPNMKGIQQKFVELSSKKSQKICEFQYFKYMKQKNFFLAKAFHCTNNTIVVIKPLQITIYQNNKQISSIQISRVINVNLQKNSVICQIQCLIGDKISIRSWTIFPQSNKQQLYQCLLYYTEVLQ